MKLFYTYAIGLLVCLGACQVSGEEQDQAVPITQDSVRVDLDTGDLFFNAEPVSLERFEELLKDSYSIDLSAVSFSGERAVVSSSGLLAVLDRIDQAGIDPKLVRLNLFFPPQMKRNQYHKIELGGGGRIALDGSDVAIADLAENQFKKNPAVILPGSGREGADYRQLLSVLRAMGGDADLAGLVFDTQESVEVDVLIYQMKPDGGMDVLSAPRLSTKPGNSAMIRVVENRTGRKTYPPGTDEYHQEDLANLGVRLSAKPQIIGDRIRVSGVAILTKMIDREGVFVEGNIPVASYSCTKIVVPFLAVFPPGKDSVEFPVAGEGGPDMMCRLTARLVDGRGMSRADREKARAMANRPAVGPK